MLSTEAKGEVLISGSISTTIRAAASGFYFSWVGRLQRFNLRENRSPCGSMKQVIERYNNQKGENHQALVDGPGDIKVRNCWSFM